MAAGTTGGGWSTTQGYKLGGLFAVLALLSLAAARVNVVAANSLRKHKRSALRHVFEHLQLELMLLGLLSLTLSTLQEPLLHICVTKKGSYGSDYCGKGKEPLWSATTLHQTHIFIFILACTHVCYVGLSTFLCSWKLRQWRKWEKESTNIVPLNPKLNPRNATGLLHLVWRAFWAQFAFSVNREMYLSLRRLFLERTGATEDFDFYDYLRESMEEDMSSIIGMTVFMWSMATIFVTLPGALFMSIGLVCLGIMVFAGTMLESVALRLSQAAYERFQEDFLPEDEDEDDIQIEKSPAERRRELRKEIDSQNFFWLGRPRLLLKTFQFVLFENAISLSMLLFALWQDKEWLTSNANMSVGGAWALFAVDFLVLLHSALFFLPVYAISSTVGSHCATSLQEYADKLGITREAALAAYLERTGSNMSPEDTAEVAAYDLSLLEKDAKHELELEQATTPDPEKVPTALRDTPGAQRNRGVSAIKAWNRTANKVVGKVSGRHRDYSRENEKSLTSLLGAILSKQMKEQLAIKKAEQAKKDAEKAASPGVIGALQRTFSKKNISSMAELQPSADDVLEDLPVTPPPTAGASMRSRPSMKDVFSMGTSAPRQRNSEEESNVPTKTRSLAEIFPQTQDQSSKPEGEE
jgi:mlo protein